MKNIHILPTDKPSRFYSTAPTATKKEGYAFGEHYIPNTRNMFSNHNIYITSDEEIKEGDWFYNSFLNEISKMDVLDYSNFRKKIILTTDQDLIKDGVQAIDDEFLQWFVKNPNCDEIEFEKFHGINTSIAEVNTISGDGSLNWQGKSDLRDYKIIIPKEELDYTALLQPVGTKQETPKEIAERYYEDEVSINAFINGYKLAKEEVCNHNYILTSEQGHRIIKCSKCNNTQPI